MQRQEYYRRLIAKHEQSGLSVPAFCRKHRISTWTFYTWRKKLGTSSRPYAKTKSRRQPGFVSVALGQSCLPDSSPHGVVEIEIDRSLLIRVSLDCPPIRIGEIVAALNGATK